MNNNILYSNTSNKSIKKSKDSKLSNESIVDSKERPEYWHKKGIEVGNAGNHEEALKCFNRAIELEPTYVDAWFYKTLALRNLGRCKEAEECFKRALVINSCKSKNNKKK